MPTNTTYWEVANVGVYASITEQILDRIKYRPKELASVSYTTDQSVKENRLRNNLFKFSYRYVYDDGEKSAWSPISAPPMPLISERFDGSYIRDETIGNVINVWMDTSVREVVILELAVQVGKDGVWKLINRKYKYNENGDRLLEDNIFSVYQFRNTEAGESLDQEDFFRLYDAVPQISQNQKLIEKNRIVDGNYIEGYDNIDIDVTLSSAQHGSGLMITFLPGINFSEITFPPTYPIQGYPKYARGIKWNVNVWQQNKYPISPMQYSCVCMDWVNVPIVYGKNYKFFISAPFYIYRNTLDPNVDEYHVENVNDKVVAEANVILQQGETLQDLLNIICNQLRITSNENYSAIGFVKSPHIGTINGTQYWNHV